MFHDASPAPATMPAASVTWSGPCRRPRPSSTWPTVDCTPSEMRVTPAER